MCVFTVKVLGSLEWQILNEISHSFTFILSLLREIVKCHAGAHRSLGTSKLPYFAAQRSHVHHERSYFDNYENCVKALE